jgi:hypothetical protein
MRVSDVLVLGLVLFDVAAMVARDVQIGTRRRRGDQRKCEAREQQAVHGSDGKPGLDLGAVAARRSNQTHGRNPVSDVLSLRKRPKIWQQDALF